MYTGTVVGNIVATRKDEKLVGTKLLVIRLDKDISDDVKTIVAVDTVGAGKGDRVIICIGSSARYAVRCDSSPVDAAIVGIIDNINS